MKIHEDGIQKNGNGSAQAKTTGHEIRGGGQAETAEQWWSRLSPAQRGLAQVIAGMMTELDQRKRIEILSDGGSIRARFIHVLEKPEAGCVSAIVLPERASGGWN